MKRRPVRTHKFTSGVYDINQEELHGLCTFPDYHLSAENHDHEIWINPKLRGFKKLETIVHESLHAENPDWPEEVVDAAGHNVARLLWRLGYREGK